MTSGHRTTCAVAVRVFAMVGAVGLLGASCTDSDDAADRITATLEIITTNIESALGEGGFETAEAGQELTVGDRVKTDDTGFAELSYHDGSWQRVENNATLSLEDLTESDDGQVVRTSVDIGRTWNRVREFGAPDDAYEVETPVATAAVRGTIFATDCPTKDVCEFRVVEGTIIITPLTGDPITMTAPSVLTVERDVEPGEPEVIPPDVLRQDPWVEKNLGADREKLRELAEQGEDEGAAGGDADPTPAELRIATLGGTYDAERVGDETNYRNDHPNHVAAGSTSERVYEFVPSCTGANCSLTIEVDDGGPQQVGFDGRVYTQREELLTDCLDDTTREPIAEDVARVVVEVRWTPTGAERIDGEWIVTEFDGTATYSTEVLKPDEFTERCYWPTTDGQPPAQVTSSTATRR